MPIRKTEIDKAPYIAYADKPGTIYEGSGGIALDKGAAVRDDYDALDFGIAYIKLGDAVIYDNYANAPYADDFQSGASYAMGLTIVLRSGDSATMSDYTLTSILYGESGHEDIPLDASLYNWDTDEDIFTLTVPTFEATAPSVAINYEYI